MQLGLIILNSVKEMEGSVLASQMWLDAHVMHVDLIIITSRLVKDVQVTQQLLKECQF